ncbi:MAG: hypothetical protein AAFR17_07130 [Pseudomonadota bacterium]
MKYLPPRMATHPQASPRVKAEVKAFYDRAAKIAAWDKARLERQALRAAERVAPPSDTQGQASDAPGEMPTGEGFAEVEIDPITRANIKAAEVLDRLEALSRAHARAQRRAQRLASTRERLADELALLLDALPEAERTALARRQSNCARLAEPGTGRAKGQTETARAALAFLAKAPEDEVRPVDITRGLRRSGHAVSDNYGASMLHVWRKGGLVQKVGHGRYRIARDHPDLISYLEPDPAEWQATALPC